MAANNSVLIRGKVISAPEYSYSYNGNDFYEFKVLSFRSNGKTDTFPIVMPWTKFNNSDVDLDSHIEVDCEVRSYKVGSRIMYFLYYIDSRFVVALPDCAQATVDGIILRKPVVKEYFFPTLNKKAKVASGLMRLDSHNRTYSVPIIFWGYGADIANGYERGMHVGVEGLISVRSFNYTNKETGEIEHRSQLEITAIRSEVIYEEEN